MTYRKYAFTPAQWQTLRSLIEVTTNKGNYWSDLITAVHEIGHIVTTPAVIEAGEVVTPAVLSPLWAVDIIWATEPHPDFAPFVVWPSNIGKHIFSGWESDYEEQYALRNS
jgi:hypothetical protein